MGQGNPDGSFLIPNVPDGDYLLTYWDQPQNYILDQVNVSVVNGEIADIGTSMLTGWFTSLEGSVFVDTNENGKRDPGENGVPNILIAVRRRENSLMDRGNITTFTDSQGNYVLENLYPLTSWLIIEAYDDRYHTVVVAWQPGIPGLQMELYATVKDTNGNLVVNADGSYAKGPLLNTTTTEQFVRPQNCQARDLEGNPVDQFVLPPASGGYDCLEAPMMGVQFQNGFTEIDGNFGFTEILTDPVSVVIGDLRLEHILAQ